MSKLAIIPGHKWVCKKLVFIGSRKIVQGTEVKIHGVAIYEDVGHVMTIINSYLETMPAEKFRSIFRKIQ